MLLVEIAGFSRLDIDYADDTVLGHQRDGQFRTDVWHRFDIPRVLRHIINQDRLAELRRLPDYSLAHFDPAAFGKFRRIPDLKAKPQFLCFFVEKQNSENFVIDDFADDLGDAAHSRIQIERRGQCIGDVEQQRLDRQSIRLGNDGTHRWYDSSRVPLGSQGERLTGRIRVCRARNYSLGTMQMSERLRYFSA